MYLHIPIHPLFLSSFWGVSTEQRTHSPTCFSFFPLPHYITLHYSKDTSIIANVKGPRGIEPIILYTVERSDQIARMRERREKKVLYEFHNWNSHRTEFLSQDFSREETTLAMALNSDLEME